jgi:drug/metabolite transporter (DMT)-like permease
MSWSSLAFIFVSVALSSGAQLLMKAGMSSPSIVRALSPEGSVVDAVLLVATSPLVIAGLFSFGMSAVTWLLVLSRLPVSQAYPFVALGIAATAAGGFFLMGEIFSVTRLAGIVVICVGVVLVALS